VPAPIQETPNDPPLPNREVWTSLLEEFHALGGIAENIVLRPSSTIPRLYSNDVEQPIFLRIPANLLVRTQDVTLHGDSISIAESVQMGEKEKAFFERYQTELSWGWRGRAESDGLIEMFDSLQPELQNRLRADFGMGPLIEGERKERILRHFLRNRAIGRRSETRLAPFLDLVNRASTGLGAKSGPDGGVQIEGKVEGEILLAYEYHDPLGTFRKHGVAVPHKQALSLPMRTKAGSFQLVIGRDPTARAQRSGFRSPQMHTESGSVHLSYLTLGDANFPRMPRTIFYALMREARGGQAADIFDQILFFNRAKYLALLEALEPYSGELESRLRSMAHCQLAALAECVGVREP
jgi:hypothetical protein